MPLPSTPSALSPWRAWKLRTPALRSASKTPRRRRRAPPAAGPRARSRRRAAPRRPHSASPGLTELLTGGSGASSCACCCAILRYSAERILQQLVVIETRLDGGDGAIDVAGLRDAAQRLRQIEGLRRLLQLEAGGLGRDASEMQVRDEMQGRGREAHIEASQRLRVAPRRPPEGAIQIVRQGGTQILLGRAARSGPHPAVPRAAPVPRRSAPPWRLHSGAPSRARVHLLQRVRGAMRERGFRRGASAPPAATGRWPPARRSRLRRPWPGR